MPLYRSPPYTHLVELAAHDVHLRRNRAQVVVRLLVADIASAEDLPDLAGDLGVSSRVFALALDSGAFPFLPKRDCSGATTKEAA